MVDSLCSPLFPCRIERNAVRMAHSRPHKDSPVRRRPQGRLPAREVVSSRAFRSCQHDTLVWSQRNAVGNSTAEAAQSHENKQHTVPQTHVYGVSSGEARAGSRPFPNTWRKGRRRVVSRVVGARRIRQNARTIALFADASAPARWKPQCLWTCEKHRAGHRMIAFGKDGCEKGCFHA
jgi:hypothetical protein